MAAAASSDDYDAIDFGVDLSDDALAEIRQQEESYWVLSQLPLRQQPRTQAVVPAPTPPPNPTPPPGPGGPSLQPKPAYTRPPPPAKKFKPNIYRPVDDDDFPVPEITVGPDGQYHVAGAPPRPAPATTSTPPSFNARPTNNASHVRQPSGSQQAQRPVPRPPPRPALGGRSSSSGGPQVARPSPLSRSTTPAQEVRAPSVRPTTPVVNGGSQGHTRSSSQTAVSPGGGAKDGQAPPPEWEKELEAMRAQLAQLRQQTEALQAAKAAAEEQQWSKAGEVSNVRRLMEQQNKANQAALDKMKAEKEELMRAKERVENEMRLALDRMKTDLMFRQHEFETTAKRPAWARSAASQMPGIGLTPARTPARRRAASSRPPSSPVGPTPARRAAQFNGFSNSFAPTQKLSPVRPRRQVNGSSPLKGKENEDATGWGRPASRKSSIGPAGESLQSEDGQPMEESVPVDFGDTTLPAAPASQQAETQEEEVEVEEVEPFFGSFGEGINWRDELHHAVFKHRSLFNIVEGSEEPPPLTLQLLLTVTLPEEAAPDAAKQYKEECANLLAAFGMEDIIVEEDGSSEELNMVGQGLARLAKVFCDLELLKPLTLCFDLLAFVAWNIPAFRRVLMAVPPEAPDSPPILLSVVRDCVRLHIQPAKMKNGEPDRRALAETCLTILETVAWRVSEDDVLKLGILPSSAAFLSALLDPAQQPWIAERAARLFCLFSSHAPLFRSMLAFADQEGGAAIRPESASIPMIDKLCHFIVQPQPNATFEQVHSTSQAVVCTMTSLSIAHPDGRQLLQSSKTLIPSLVRCLRALSTHLFDGDESLIDYPERQPILLQTLHLCLTLFHFLGVSSELSEKLRNATRFYNGITHDFIRAIGRLSYAEPPEWLSPESAKRVEQMRDQARDLFEDVIETPEEGDSVWAAYQDDWDESGSATEAEEEQEEPEQPDIPMDED